MTPKLQDTNCAVLYSIFSHLGTATRPTTEPRPVCWKRLHTSQDRSVRDHVPTFCQRNVPLKLSFTDQISHLHSFAGITRQMFWEAKH